MNDTRRLVRLAPPLVAVLALALVGTLPGGSTAPADAEDRELPSEPEAVQMALIEVDDPSTLSLLASQGVDLDHYTEPTDDGTILSAAFVDSDGLDELRAMGVEVLDLQPTPTPEEVAEQRMGNVDGQAVADAPTGGVVAEAQPERGDPRDPLEEARTVHARTRS